MTASRLSRFLEKDYLIYALIAVVAVAGVGSITNALFNEQTRKLIILREEIDRLDRQALQQQKYIESLQFKIRALEKSTASAREPGFSEALSVPQKTEAEKAELPTLCNNNLLKEAASNRFRENLRADMVLLKPQAALIQEMFQKCESHLKPVQIEGINATISKMKSLTND